MDEYENLVEKIMDLVANKSYKDVVDALSYILWSVYKQQGASPIYFVVCALTFELKMRGEEASTQRILDEMKGVFDRYFDKVEKIREVVKTVN